MVAELALLATFVDPGTSTHIMLYQKLFSFVGVMTVVW
jgi:hypothetical protein